MDFKKKYSFSINKNNIWLVFVPFLIVYVIIVIVLTQNQLHGDQHRYLTYANNILHGFYVDPHYYLMSGPGYPLLLTPILFFKLPIITIGLLNGFLLYFSLIITYKSISEFASIKKALFFTILLGLYFPILEMLPLILSETLTWFLISIICLFFIKNFKNDSISWKYVLLTSFSISYLAMTKVIFGYVILIMLAVSILVFFLSSYHTSAKKSAIIFLLSLIFCLPYLFYTYHLTNKVFYWSDSGGDALYTMSTPYANELGDWKSQIESLNNPNHSAFIESISNLDPVAKDDALKVKAMQNIKKYPIKYFSNWVNNIGRILFSYPYSNAQQSINTYFTLIPNMFVFVFILFSIGISVWGYKKTPVYIFLLFLFIMIYLLGNSLVFGARRIFYITMPFWILLISYIFTNLISVKFKQN